MLKYLKCIEFFILIELIFVLVGGGYEKLMESLGYSSDSDVIFYLGFPLALIVIALILKYASPDTISKVKIWVKPSQGSLRFILLGIGVSLLIFLLIICYASLSRMIRIGNLSNSGTLILILYKSLAIAGLVGFSEEMIYRGMITAYFIKNSNTIFTLVFVSLFFSLGHLSYNGILPYLSAFVMGIICTLSLIFTGSLYFAIGLHIGWNYAFAVYESVFEFCNKGFPINDLLMEGIQFVFLFVFLIAILIKERKKLNLLLK